jgi:putative PIN family toxin of toxin-antitoxin system
VSAAIFPRSTPGRAVREGLRRGEFVLSAATTEELAEVLGRPKFDRYISSRTRQRFLAAVVHRAHVVETNQSFHVCRDPKDDKFLELAVCSNVSFLVTGDKDMLALHPFQGISIVTPARFLAALTSA